MNRENTWKTKGTVNAGSFRDEPSQKRAHKPGSEAAQAHKPLSLQQYQTPENQS